MIRRLLPSLLLLFPFSFVSAQEVLTLEDALDRALSENYTIRVARNRATVAENNASLGNAGFLPRWSVNAGYNGTIANTEQTFIDNRVQSVTGAQTTRQNAASTLQWTVFDGLGRMATYDRLKAERALEAAATENTVETIVADVTILYFDLVRQQEQVGVLNEAVGISEERLRIAEARFDLGSASELEVRQARVDLNTDRAARLRQESALIDAKATFDRLLARPVGAPFSVKEDVVVDTSLALEPVRTATLDQNPALEQAQQNVLVSELTRREIAAERFPSIDLNLSYGYSNLSAESGFLISNRSFAFDYGLSLTYDLFDGLNRRRRLQNAQIERETAEFNLEDVRAQLEADLTRLYTSYRNSLILMALEQENLEATRLNVEVALERFRLGTITSVELREVQEQLIQAESRLITAQFEAKRAETELRRLSGALVTEA